MQLIRYSNPTSEDCDGGYCDEFPGPCENIFEFCLRTVGGSSCLSEISTDDIEDDIFTFGPSELDDLGISNPLQFTNIATTVSNSKLS